MKTLKLEKRGAVATVRLSRPDQRNAVNEVLAAELIETLNALAKDDSVRCVVLTGDGKAFCSGADLSQFEKDLTPKDVEVYLDTNYKPIIRAITTMSKPVIGSIGGAAAGAGMALALSCDLRIMSDNAGIYPAFINIGLVPDAGSSWFLARHVGYSKALEFLIAGKGISAETCLQWGLANRVVRPDMLDQETFKWAQELAEKPTHAIGLTKKCLAFAFTNSLDDSFDLEAKLQGMAVMTRDHSEGFRAFRAKETPKFTGK